MSLGRFLHGLVDLPQGVGGVAALNEPRAASKPALAVSSAVGRRRQVSAGIG